MKQLYITLLLTLILIGGISYGQDQVRLRIESGIPMIPVAIPELESLKGSESAQKLTRELYQILWNDVEFSRVFRLIPREHYSYIQKFNSGQINFKDWASIMARILVTGSVDVPQPDRIVFSLKVYDTGSEQFIFGRNYGGKTDLLRLIAHRAANELMKHFGEKPIYTSKILFVSKRDGNNEIYMMDYDGHRQRRITFNETIDILPAWSSDNEKIMYTSYRHSTNDLFLFHLYSGKLDLLSTGGVNYAVDWSPTGDRIVYTSSKEGNAEIYVRDMKTGKERRLTFNNVIDSTPSWSPNGREIAFTSQRSGTPQIYIMDAEGTNVRRITKQGNYHDSARWSPDGTQIILVSRIVNQFDLYLYNLRTNTIRKLTENSGKNENPSWSPDGRHIVFASNRAGPYQIYVMDYDGTNLRRLTSEGQNMMPRWQNTIK